MRNITSFANLLNGTGEIHLPLGELGFGGSRRAAEQLVERPVGHGETGEVVRPSNAPKRF